jgi:hypothetical protein
MPELANLNKVNETFVQRLRQTGIETVDDLWACVGVDINTGLRQVAANAHISPSLLMALLIAETLDDLKEGGRPYPILLWLYLKRYWQKRSRYWLTVLLILLLLLTFALGLRAVLINLRTQLTPARTHLRFSAFRSNIPQDVAYKNMLGGAITPSSNASADARSAESHRREAASLYGTSSTAQELLTTDPFEELRGRRILSIPVKPGSFSSALSLATRVWLLFSPRESGEKAAQPLVVKDAILLAIDHQGEAVSIVIAVNESELEKIKPLLGTSDVFVL